MATSTIETELSVVNIVGPVAVPTATAHALHCCKRLPVAGVAGRVGVCAFQRKVCPKAVIELPGEPVDRVVAGAAIVREPTSVRVVVTMTFDAKFGRITEHMSFVAVPAFRFRMPAKQWKTGEIVIEEHVILPGRLVVAIVTPDSLFAFVGIVVGVAVAAAGLQDYLENRLDVAGLAFDRRVRAPERVLCIAIVIEVTHRP